MKKNSNHNNNNQTKRRYFKHICEVLKFHNFWISNFSNNENDHGLQFKRFAIVFVHLNDNIQSSMNFPCSFETKPIHIKKYKWQWFLNVCLTKSFFDKNQIKRQSSKIRFIQISISDAVEISNWHDDQLYKFFIMYDVVLVILTDCLRIKYQDIDINNHINILLQKFNEFLI